MILCSIHIVSSMWAKSDKPKKKNYLFQKLWAKQSSNIKTHENWSSQNKHEDNQQLQLVGSKRQH